MKKLKKFLLKVWYLFRFNRSFAQDGDDIIFEEYWIADRGKKQTGFYVEIGGYHPVRFSNTYRLYLKGWNGVIVEPTPGKKALFRFMRPRDVFVPIAAGKERKTVNLEMFDEGALNRIAKAKSGKTAVVDQATTAQILKETVPDGTEIALMSIDVEGNELEVLQGNDWTKHLPAFILIEDDFFDIENPNTPTYNYLKKRQYKPIAKTRRNVLYKKM